MLLGRPCGFADLVFNQEDEIHRSYYIIFKYTILATKYIFFFFHPQSASFYYIYLQSILLGVVLFNLIRYLGWLFIIMVGWVACWIFKYLV
jgi:hypothetical protein